jgi:hypothetical protein
MKSIPMTEDEARELVDDAFTGCEARDAFENLVELLVETAREYLLAGTLLMIKEQDSPDA